jgi:hypothetical protein
MKYKVGDKIRYGGYLAEITGAWKSGGNRYEILFIKGKGKYTGYWGVTEESIDDEGSRYKSKGTTKQSKASDKNVKGI